jgi:hypothetical protein
MERLGVASTASGEKMDDVASYAIGAMTSLVVLTV